MTGVRAGQRTRSGTAASPGPPGLFPEPKNFEILCKVVSKFGAPLGLAGS